MVMVLNKKFFLFDLKLFKYMFVFLLGVFLIGCGGASGGNSNSSGSADVTAPVLTLEGDKFINVSLGEAYGDAGATAIDDVDGDLSSTIVIIGSVDTSTVGSYVLVYSVIDAAGNEALLSRTVIVVDIIDTIAPILTLQGIADLNHPVGMVYSDSGVIAVDNVDGDLSANIIVTGSVDSSTIGRYILTYNVSDSAGNAAEPVSRTVIVVFADTSVRGTSLTVTLKELQFSWSAVVGADHYRLLEDADGMSGFSVLVNNIPDPNYNHPIDKSTSNWLQAQYLIEACDVSEQSCVSSTQSLVVSDNVIAGLDVVSPIITLQGVSPLEISVGTIYSDVGATATDDVDGDISANIVVEGVVDTTTIGSYVLIYSVSDAAGNIALTVSRTVNVVIVDITGATLNVTPKELQFSWNAVAGSDHYRLLENPDGASGFSVIANNITATYYNHPIAVHQTDWLRGQYRIESCDVNELFCVASIHSLSVIDSVAATVYMKASNTEGNDRFGFSVSLSGDGQTLAVGAKFEDSIAVGVNGDQADNSAIGSGAVYLYGRDVDNHWVQQTYLKASNTGSQDQFGYSVSLSDDGQLLAVGAVGESSSSVGVNGNESNDNSFYSGAVYLFVRDSTGTWVQEAYIKASNTGARDEFGYAISLSGDGQTLAVGARLEDGATARLSNSGAAYLFVRDSTGTWVQQAYIKASNTGAPNLSGENDEFGYAISLSRDGQTLAVGATGEDSAATGVGGDQLDNTALNSGAVYLFTYDVNVNDWSQQTYLKASNTGGGDVFGRSVSLSGDGQTLAVGAINEDSSATGINGAVNSGAVYLFTYDDVSGFWKQSTYLKASNTGSGDWFGYSVSLSDDGQMLAVSGAYEDSNSIGLNGNASDNSAVNAGAVYLFIDDVNNGWMHRSYIKSSNANGVDIFGESVSLSGDGQTLAVGAYGEDSNATGVNGDQADNTALNAGAVYLY